MTLLMHAEATVSDTWLEQKYITLSHSKRAFSCIPIVNPRDSDYDRLLRDYGWNRKTAWVLSDGEFVAQIERWAN